MPARLFGPQRAHRAARLGQAILREIADPREDRRQRRVARAVVHGFFRGAELHEDAGEALREAVVDFLAHAVALGEHRRGLRGHAEFLDADRQRRLVRERHRELGALGGQRFVLAEHEADEAHAVLAEHQRQQVRALVSFARVPLGDAGPREPVERLEWIEDGFAELLEDIADAGLFFRRRALEGRLGDAAVLDEHEDLPAIVRGVEADGVGRGGVELAGRVDQRARDEIARVGFAREAQQIRTQRAVRAMQLRDAFFGRELAFAAHGVDQPLAMQRGADEAGRDFERGDHEESNLRARRQSSKPMTPTYSPSTRMGTIAELFARSLVMLSASCSGIVSEQ